MAKFKVTIVRTITTSVFIDAATAKEARKKVEDHGLIESAMDMSDQDEVFARISTVTPVDGI